MKILVTGVLAICLLLASFPSQSVGFGWDPGKIYLKANIVLDAYGTLTSIEWLDTKPSGRVVTEPLEKAVRSWEFEPGKLNGVPAITQTGLSLDVTLRKTGKHEFVLRIDDARTGPLPDVLAPPSYPRNQARSGAQAYVDLLLDTDDAGNVVSATVADYAGSNSTKSSRKEFEAAALGMAHAWKFRPELVGGKPLATGFTVPVWFCIDTWCSMHERKLAASGKNVRPSGTPIAVNSAVRILSNNIGVEM